MLTHNWRFLLWAIGIAACSVALSVMGAQYKPGVVVKCISRSNEDIDRLKSLTVQALDEAFVHQVAQLYEVWMRDPHGQPQRAQAGVSQAAEAWLDARAGAAKFQPPECPR